MRHALFPALVLFIATLSACTGGNDLPATTPTSAITPPAASPTYDVELQDGPCSFDLPNGQDTSRVRCGFVSVPEDRSAPNGRSMRLAFAVLGSSSDTPGPPLLILDGGPGGSTLRGILGWFTGEFAAPLQDQRDLVFFDYRGTGLSEPDMSCPELDALGLTTSTGEKSREQEEEEAEAALMTCRDRILQAGVALNAFHTAELATDAADLMRALGYALYDVYGVSYGTRVALALLRDRPNGIERVILDSVYPPEADLFAGLALNQQHALERVLAACARQDACAAAYPDLEEKLLATVDRLNAQPVELEARDATTGSLRPVTVDGTVLLSLLFGSVSSDKLVARIPAAIEGAWNGQFGALTPALDARFGAAGGSTGAVPMRTSVLCSEELPFTSPEDLDAASAELWPAVGASSAFGLISEADLRDERDFCRRWGVSTRPDVDSQAVQSGVPALILSGAFDPSTPPEWALMVSEALSDSTLVEFAGRGHGLLLQEDGQCAMGIVAAFLEGTSPLDAACASAEAQFDVRAAGDEVAE